MNKLSILTLLLPIVGNAAIYEPNALWTKSSIKVCFYDQKKQIKETKYSRKKKLAKKQGFMPGFLDNFEKLAVEKIVKQTFHIDSTHIHFVGWDDCSRSNGNDVIIMKANEVKRFLAKNIKVKFEGKSSIGQDGIIHSYTSTDFGIYEKNLSKKAVVVLKSFDKFTVRHEFGHLAGLRHEQANRDVLQDTKCVLKRAGKTFDFRQYAEPLGRTAIIATDYDYKSIMNYCSMILIQKDATYDQDLTEKDKETLRSLY